jgi:hypothetical protein
MMFKLSFSQPGWGRILIMAPVLCWPVLAAAQTATPEVAVRVLSPQETEFRVWTVAEEKHTTAAYQQYLDMYPSGRYADRARAALLRLQEPPKAATRAVLPPAGVAVSMGLRELPAKLLEGAPRSPAVTQMPGETYQGPGPMTVGYLGAKKQLVLPSGTWVLLAVRDRQSGHQNNPVPLVSMVFAQYRAGQVLSFMSYLFNGRPASARNWGDFEDCNNKPQAHVLRVQESTGSARLCGWTERLKQTAHVEDPGWEAALDVSARLGAPVPIAPLLFTRVTTLDTSGHYLTMRRADFSQVGDGEAALQARHAWVKAYVPLMLSGFDKKIAADELEPERGKLASGRVHLPD